MNSREAIIALNMLPKIGPVRVRRLLEQFGSAEAIFKASKHSLTCVSGVGNQTAEIIIKWEEYADLTHEMNEVKCNE